MKSIVGIQLMERSLPNCEQYVLKAKKTAMYPILQTTHGGRSEIKSWILLNVGEVWRMVQLPTVKLYVILEDFFLPV